MVKLKIAKRMIVFLLLGIVCLTGSGFIMTEQLYRNKGIEGKGLVLIRLQSDYISIINNYIENIEPIVYDGFTMQELADKLNLSLSSTLEDTGYIFASKSIEYGIDPYLAVAIVLHETGCTWQCSTLVKSCNNVGGMKGNPGCGGGSYATYSTLEEGIEAYFSNLYRNYYSYGLTDPEAIGNKYASSSTWASKINWYIDTTKSK